MFFFWILTIRIWIFEILTTAVFWILTIQDLDFWNTNDGGFLDTRIWIFEILTTADTYNLREVGTPCSWTRHLFECNNVNLEAYTISWKISETWRRKYASIKNYYDGSGYSYPPSIHKPTMFATSHPFSSLWTLSQYNWIVARPCCGRHSHLASSVNMPTMALVAAHVGRTLNPSQMFVVRGPPGQYTGFGLFAANGLRQRSRIFWHRVTRWTGWREQKLQDMVSSGLVQVLR